MSAMIPHHSMAITRSERAEIMDQRVCEIAVEISEAQRRELLEMEWLIEDIKENGLATTIAAAEARSVPYFELCEERLCRRDLDSCLIEEGECNKVAKNCVTFLGCHYCKSENT